ncbi:MAG: CRISPR-associated DxTHG motif protein, partial [Crenarchaeota archaeon]|nr:CRISPR-associated DxTHG motif protein [Thermoproteota archaeon]
MPGENVVTAIYAVLGQFQRWQPADYVIEDVDKMSNRANRHVYGYKVSEGEPKKCKIRESECRPFSMSVAEYALALHKLLLRSREVHLTFFTPLSLLDFGGCRAYYGEDVLELLKALIASLARKLSGDASRLGNELGQVVSGLARSLASPGELILHRVGRGGVSYLALGAAASFPFGRVYSYFVPVPARLTQRDRESGCLVTHRGEIGDIEAVMRLWISGVLAKARPAEVVVDTTHGINYLASLLDKSFWASLNTVPISRKGEKVFVEVYNTDPVLSPVEGFSYKYHLIGFQSHTTGRSEQIVGMISDALNILEIAEKRFGELVWRLNALLKVAVNSFRYEVPLWGYIFAEKAFEELRRVLETLPSKEVGLRVKVSRRGNIVSIDHILALASEAHPKDASTVTWLGWLYGVLEVLISRWEMLRRELRILNVNIEGKSIYTLDVCAAGEEEEEGQRIEEDEKVEEDLPAALTLLRYQLRDLGGWRPEHRCRDKVLRHFIAHAGLSGDVVECVK